MNSGKTSLVYRLVKNSFVERMEPTIGYDLKLLMITYLLAYRAAFMVKNLQVDGVQIKLEIWDTAGMYTVGHSFMARGWQACNCFCYRSRAVQIPCPHVLPWSCSGHSCI